MKKIIALSIAAIVIISIAGMGTYAYFSDTAKSASNEITAGTLYLTPGFSSNLPFMTVANTAAVPTAGSGQDEVTTLQPQGSVNTGNYLSIKIANLTLTSTGFPTGLVHDLNGTVVTAGDLGKYAQAAIWLTHTPSETTPVSGDIELLPPGTLDGAHHAGTTLTMTGSNEAFYTWNNYVDQASAYTTSDYATWDNVLGAAMGSTEWYFHVTWKIPEGGVTDSVYQGLKIASDFYFTLATSNAPY
jgi:predicted ribosomally synthesized peptide with SipW-like signal peptide